MNSVKVFTNSSFNETIEIEKYLQPVTYHVVLGMNFFADFMSSFSDFFGGKSKSYQSRLESINREVIQGIKTKTHLIGGNAAIDLKIDNDEISAQGKSMIMVTAIATAVIIKEKQKIESSINQKVEDAIGAINISELEELQQKYKALDDLEDADRLTLGTRLKKLDDKDFDLLPEIFDAIIRVDVDPNILFQDETLETKLHNGINSLSYQERSEFLFKQFDKVLEIKEQQSYSRKLVFLKNRIIKTNSVNYQNINQLFGKDNELDNVLADVLIFGRKDKSLFFKSDIRHLEEMGKIISNLELNKDISTDIEGMKSILEKIFRDD